MKRTVKKQFWFSKVEAQDLKKKAKKACLTEAALIRLLLRGYEREKNRTRDFMTLCGSFPLSATTSISSPLKRTPSALWIRKC